MISSRSFIRSLGVVLLSFAWTLTAHGQEKDKWTEVYQDFRNSAPLHDSLRLTGPQHKEVAKPGADGLRITLPADRPEHYPVTLLTDFEVAGDFELTATYEWISVALPKKGYGAGIALTVQSDGARRQFAKISRVMRHDHKSGDVYMAESWDNDIPKSWRGKMEPATARTGQLRLERTGDVMRYLVADPPTNVFREVLKQKFFTGPMESAHVAVTDSGEPGNEVDVRLIDWKIRMSKANPDIAAAPKTPPRSRDPVPDPTGQTNSGDEPARGVPRLVWVLIAALVLLAGAVGTWLVVRSRRGSPAAAPAAAPAAVDTPIALTCAGCKKPLKVKRAFAGKSVKCPQCGHVNNVPK